MDIVQRAKNMIVTPATEWTVVAGESTPQATLITGYVLPLAGAAAIAAFIGQSFVGISTFGFGTYRVPIMTGLVGAILGVVMAVVMVFIVATIIDALAPTFGTQKNSPQAFKLAVFSFTPGWIAGLLQILPMLAVIGILAGLYGLYLLYLGLPRVMGTPTDKALPYTLVVAVCAIVVMVILGMIRVAVMGTGHLAAGGLSGITSQSSTPAFDPNSALGQLEQSAKKMEAAAQKGDTSGQAAAALEGLGALFGGGRRVDPLEIDQLKAFVPESLGGMTRASTRGERKGMGGIMVASTEGRFGEGDRVIDLEIIDSGGMSGMVGLASWAGAMEEREDDDGFERTRKVDGRIVHEKSSKRGQNEFAVVLGNRFIVTAKSQGVSLDELKAAVGSLDLARLEGLKDAGVK